MQKRLKCHCLKDTGKPLAEQIITQAITFVAVSCEITYSETACEWYKNHQDSTGFIQIHWQ